MSGDRLFRSQVHLRMGRQRQARGKRRKKRKRRREIKRRGGGLWMSGEEKEGKGRRKDGNIGVSKLCQLWC